MSFIRYGIWNWPLHITSNTDLQSLTVEEAETLVLKTLKQVMEEKLDSKNVQLASVTKERGFRIYTDAEMAAVVERLPAN
jgi:20S proteasome subunit alpha 5